MTQDEPRKKFQRLINSEGETQAEPASQPVPQPTRTSEPIPAAPRPALDKNNMPVPRRVSETDMGGTRVTPAAFETKTTPRRTTAPPPRLPQPGKAGITTAA